MKTHLLTIFAATNLAVGMSCYWLGSKRALPQSDVAVPANLTSLVPNPSTQDINSRESLASKDLPSLTSMAMAGPGFRDRLGNLMSDIEDMDSEEVLASLKELRYQPGSSDSMLAQQLLLARYAELDPETALSYVDTLGGFNHEMSNLTVMSAWTAQDPEAASRYIESNLDDFGTFDESQRVAAGSVAAEWARIDPNAALDWAGQLSEDVRGEAYGRIIAQLTNENPTHAAKALAEMEPGYERTEMMETLVDQWAYQDPEAASAWVLENTDGKGQQRAVTSLVSAWMNTNSMEASTWLSDLTEGPAKDSAIVAMTQSRAVSRDPEARIAWSATIQDPNLRSEAIQTAVGQWVSADPDSAEAWLRMQAGH